MSTVRMHRSRRRPRGKAGARRTLWVCPIVMVAVLLSVFYIGEYHRQIELVRYPLKHRELIVEMASQFELEPWHVAAVICCESGFQDDAVSSVGARGMMQIMPDTGEWLAGKFDEEHIYNPDMLFDPETNVKYGCWYLSWLMRRYEGDMPLVTAAYHAGHGTVDRWLDDPEISQDGKRLIRIPFSSTESYIKRVEKAYDKYQELYDWNEGRDAS